MSISVESLKELIEFYERPDEEVGPNYISDASRETSQALRELIAIKEAEPVAWLVHAEHEFVDMHPQILGGLPRTPLIRKPE